ncbi:hypothetical protein M406DRAFT_254593 [Cryphonectria parasitica EP155]|uniref:Uncharacterized protein n=1 Tax=Cryphonectria parasitica (strain ATCC 38755 / EP155) TaxID=660469 RepID=A0A9P5CR46_CRYP1|nr:uncharacterized protein M406DRAFT_254593 [Cryphonectria parasitica EP155]KAF3766730.1 hypothetical protein M406DRAFT_254593 [Cryphonectria parasitica EP155]
MNQQPGEALQLRGGGGGGGSPFNFTSSSSADPLSPQPLPSPSPPFSSTPAASAYAYSSCPAKMKVDDLVAMSGAAPPETNLMPTPQSVEELTRIYYEIYAPGLCHFFESRWFNFKTEGHNPVSILLHNRPLISLLGSFLVSLHTVNADPVHTAFCSHIETRVVWALTKLAYTTQLGANTPRDDPLPDDNASEARNRVCVVETLLEGEDLTTNPLLPPPRNADPQRRKEYDFWYSLAESLRLPDRADRHQLLQRMRMLLDGRENRDLLYSLAIIRHLAPEYETGWEDRVPDHLNEKDPLNQLHVAIQFVKAESSPTGGTTNVVRHFAHLAIKALINPGVNLSKKA